MATPSEIKIVTLTHAEIEFAAIIGSMRQAMNIRDEREHKHGYSEMEGFAMHIMGTQGELAVAKWRNVYWSGALGNFRAADVGKRIQARASAYAESDLCVHKPPNPENNWIGDKPDDFFVGCRVLLPYVHLIGWMRGGEAQKTEFWKALPKQPNRPAYFVSLKFLHPMDELPEIESALERAA